jgi:paired small multidrug resistance pump
MNTIWLLVYMSVIFEVSWVTGLKHANHPLEWTLTAISIFISFFLLIYSTKRLPISTVYAVFTGLGAAGTVLVELLFFSNHVNWLKIALCAVLISGVIGLKMVTVEHDTPSEGEV